MTTSLASPGEGRLAMRPVGEPAPGKRVEALLDCGETLLISAWKA
jgi:hypothetical protein